MRWNLAIAVLIGFVLAIALSFGGPILKGPMKAPMASPPLHAN